MINSVFMQFAATEVAEKSGLGVLGINTVSLVLQFVTFLILFFLLKKFAFGPIVKALDERRKTIDKGVELGHKMEEQQAKLEEDIDKALHKARVEADKIVAMAQAEANDILKTAEKTANDKTAGMLADAEAQIATATEKAKLELKAEMVELVADATSELIGKKLDAKTDAELISRALSEVRR